MCEIGIQIELETLFHTRDKNSADVLSKYLILTLVLSRCLKIPEKKSHSTLRAKRATFTLNLAEQSKKAKISEKC